MTYIIVLRIDVKKTVSIFPRPKRASHMGMADIRFNNWNLTTYANQTVLGNLGNSRSSLSALVGALALQPVKLPVGKAS